MNKTWRTVSITILLILGTIRGINYLSRPEGNAQIISKNYEPQWRDDAGYLHSQLKESLEKSRVEYTNYYIKKSIKTEDEVLLACTNDEETFSYFIYGRYSGLDRLDDDGISKPKSTNTIAK